MPLGAVVVDGPVLVTRAARERLVLRFGPEADRWCEALPSLVGELAARWDLRVVESLGGGTSRVFRCFQEGAGRTVWLKVTPDPAIAAQEAEALALWSGTPSVVGLLARDLTAGALLLADVAPGRPAGEHGRRLPEVAVLLRELRLRTPRPAEPSVLRPLAERIDLLFGLAERRPVTAGGRRVAPAVLERARARCLELCGSGPVGLVHGDLHAANVLVGPGGRLVAIDPRPAWGDPDFDAVDWVLGGVLDLTALRRRIASLASLVPGQSPERVLAWCRALAALEAAPRLRAGRDDAETRFLLSLAR
ncbi:aminoglycoside phosphotransferase family protein [Streptomyces chilikensis]|uniref:aminoglycoside phosphotransferase family protein n=1 Tax=Streptomyces chilikensis TaxID=1194079 RepID=UPI001F108C7B|nr:aminoglycoside phosphotransferase family protein [Streptomyces chilikensis]